VHSMQDAAGTRDYKHALQRILTLMFFFGEDGPQDAGRGCSTQQKMDQVFIWDGGHGRRVFGVFTAASEQLFF
jgi:hypothetical protein